MTQRPPQALLFDLDDTLWPIGPVIAAAETGADSSHIDGAMQHFNVLRNAVTLFDDVAPVLAELGGMLRLGVITNGNADLEVIGLHHHFEVALASARFGRAKPDPSIFLAACEAMGVAPADAVYVGDDLRLDVRGAQAVGMRAVWMNRTGSTAHLDAGIAPDAICADFHDLLAWLKPQLGARAAARAPG